MIEICRIFNIFVSFKRIEFSLVGQRISLKNTHYTVFKAFLLPCVLICGRIKTLFLLASPPFDSKYLLTNYQLFITKQSKIMKKLTRHHTIKSVLILFYVDLTKFFTF
jgi:hypothetical protein